jgi:hypothetical protein
MTFNRAWIVCPHWGSWGGAVVGMMHAHLAEIHMLNNDPVKLLKFSIILNFSHQLKLLRQSK